jgi:hypothetical protein
MEETFCGRAYSSARRSFGEMRLKKISKRGSAIIALVVVLAALVGTPAASAAGLGASWVSSDLNIAPTASWGEAL